MTTLAGITLPDDLIWQDEFDWLPVEQGMTRTLGGKQVLQHRPLIKGRPITLVGGERFGWITRDSLSQLYNLAATVNDLTLLLNDGRSFSVQFRYNDTPIQAEPLQPSRIPELTDVYIRLKISLKTV